MTPPARAVWGSKSKRFRGSAQLALGGQIHAAFPASNSTVAFGDFNASDVTSSFDQLKVIYKKVGNNESQAFGVWQQLSESERTAAFAHTQRLQGDLSSRSYLYVYLRDKEWMKAM